MVKNFMILALVGSSMARRTDFKKAVDISKEDAEKQEITLGSSNPMNTAMLGSILKSGVSIQQEEGLSIVRLEGEIGDKIISQLKQENDGDFVDQTTLRVDIAYKSASVKLEAAAETRIQGWGEKFNTEMDALKAKHSNCGGTCAFVLCTYAGTSLPQKQVLPVDRLADNFAETWTESTCPGDSAKTKAKRRISGKCFLDERGKQLRGLLSAMDDMPEIYGETIGYLGSQGFSTLILKAFGGSVPAVPCQDIDVTPPNSEGVVVKRSVAPSVVESEGGRSSVVASSRPPSVSSPKSVSKQASSRQSSNGASISNESEIAEDFKALMQMLGPGEGSITNMPGLGGDSGMDVDPVL